MNTPPMIPLLFFPKLFIAGGVFLGTLQLPPDVPLDNHTLLGEKIPAAQVVTRSYWGTPMLPDGKGGYSLIAPIKKNLIEQSLWIPPVSGTRPVVEAPLVTNAVTTPVLPTTASEPLPDSVPKQ
jgi:hypothetical protein